MDNIFRPYLEFCLVYIDDIPVASKTEIEHVDHLKKIISELDKHGIVISERKMQLFQTEIDFVGMHINKGKLSLAEHITKKILEFSDQLKDRKQLQSFLGLLNCAADFIKDLASKRQSLTSKLKGTDKTNPFY